MAINEIRENDIGTVFEIEVRNNSNAVIDISSATVKNFIFTKPNGDTLTKAGSFSTDGTDGLLRYISESGVLTPVGHWCYQILLTLDSGQWHTDIGKFKVYPNLA